MLVSRSGADAFATAIRVEVNSGTPVPKLRAEIRLPKLEGHIDQFHYLAMDVKIVLEITPKPERPRMDSPQPLRRVAPVPVAVPQPGLDWSRIIGVGLVVVAGAVVVGTLVEDFLTAGAGIADDPASFALAGAAFTRGLAMIRGGAATAALLPVAPVPARVRQVSRITLD